MKHPTPILVGESAEDNVRLPSMLTAPIPRLPYTRPALTCSGTIQTRTRGSDGNTLESGSKMLSETAGEIEDSSSDVETISDDPV